MAEHRIANMGKLKVPHYADLPMQGVANWVNPFNGVEVLALHYTAHSEHRSLTWRHETMRDFTDQAWEQEMELNFESFGGRPVYSSFDSTWHVARMPQNNPPGKISLTYYKGLEMFCGWDIGIHAAVIGQCWDRHLYIYAARQMAGAFLTNSSSRSPYQDQEYNVSGLGQFIQLVKEFRNVEFPGVTWRDVGDPTIANETVQRQGTAEQIFRQNGIRLQMAPSNKILNRTNIINDWLDWSPPSKEGPRTAGLLIDPSCTLVIDGMQGGYAFSKHGAGEEPEKGAFSHTQDCIQYMALCLNFTPYGKNRQAREVQPVNVDAALLRKELERVRQNGFEESDTESWRE